jgi:hypothetical protein
VTAAIATVTVGRTWKLWAYRYESGALWHVGPKKWVELHALPYPLVPVLVEEILGDRYAAEVTHYGWEDRGRQRQTPTMIQVRVGRDPKRALMLLSTCVSISTDDGAVVALRITETAAVICDDCVHLTADKQKLLDEITRLRAEVDRLSALTHNPAQSGSDDAATRFSLLELD